MPTVGTLLIRIDGGSIDEVDATHDYSDLPMIDIGESDYYLAPSSEVAGEAVRERWRDNKENPREFRALIGDERLIQWACGESDGFGISSFDEFLDRVGDNPGEELASYDGAERDALINLPLAEAIGWDNTDDAELASDLLAESIGLGEIEIPETVRADNPELNPDWRTMTDDEAKEWARIIGLAEGSDVDDGSIGEILDTFLFISCVAYRHN